MEEYESSVAEGSSLLACYPEFTGKQLLTF